MEDKALHELEAIGNQGVIFCIDWCNEWKISSNCYMCNCIRDIYVSGRGTTV